ncbi:hypothetical protein ACP8HI_12915 [Paenibacillus sp. FA6]|uniref:hypothetical protein n=1 Tax=Paenibacillus sp. FA6 TaxID=3413029 RepID=UPI003F65E54E
MIIMLAQAVLQTDERQLLMLDMVGLEDKKRHRSNGATVNPTTIYTGTVTATDCSYDRQQQS